MARTHTTGFALIDGAATDDATPREVIQQHKREANQREADRIERVVKRAAAGEGFTVQVPEGRSADARRKVGQRQPYGWKM